MRTKLILFGLIVVMLLIIWLITNWLVLAGVIVATSALTWFVTSPLPCQDEEEVRVIVIDGQTWIDGVDYEWR